MTTATPPYLPPNVRTTFRRSAIAAAVIGLVTLAVLLPLGYGLFALFACIGLALGLGNARMVGAAAARFADAGGAGKGRLAISALGRLGLCTVLALGCAVLVRPDGLGVFAGLAVFQLAMIVVAALPVIKELRHS